MSPCFFSRIKLASEPNQGSGACSKRIRHSSSEILSLAITLSAIADRAGCKAVLLISVPVFSTFDKFFKITKKPRGSAGLSSIVSFIVLSVFHYLLFHIAAYIFITYLYKIYTAGFAGQVNSDQSLGIAVVLLLPNLLAGRVIHCYVLE